MSLGSSESHRWAPFSVCSWALTYLVSVCRFWSGYAMYLFSLSLPSFPPPLFFFFKDYSIYLKGRVTDREGDIGREILHLLVHSPNSCNGWGLARPKPRARSFIWISHTGAGVQRVESFSAEFLCPLAGSWVGSGAAGTESSTHMGSGVAGAAWPVRPQSWPPSHLCRCSPRIVGRRVLSFWGLEEETGM